MAWIAVLCLLILIRISGGIVTLVHKGHFEIAIMYKLNYVNVLYIFQGVKMYSLTKMYSCGDTKKKGDESLPNMLFHPVNKNNIWIGLQVLRLKNNSVSKLFVRNFKCGMQFFFVVFFHSWFNSHMGINTAAVGVQWLTPWKLNQFGLMWFWLMANFLFKSKLKNNGEKSKVWCAC